MAPCDPINQDSQDSLIVLGLSEEDRREIFVSTFPELAHICHSSSQEEREIASRKLDKRLGIRSIRVVFLED